MKNFSILEYQYCDASGYKAYGDLLVEGLFSDDDLQLLREYMYDREFFVPEEVGIPPLQSNLWDEFGGPNEDDHYWHTIETTRMATSDDMSRSAWGTKENLFQQFKSNQEKRKW